MEATDLARIKCHTVDHGDELHRSDTMMRDKMEQEEAKWHSDEVEDLADENEDMEMLAWCYQTSGIHLHISEVYKAYEAYGEWRQRMQDFDDDMDSDRETEDDTMSKVQLKQHLHEEAALERAVPTIAKPPWQVRCDHCSRITTTSSVHQVLRCAHCRMRNEWPPGAYLRRLAKELHRLTDEDMDERREAIRIHDENKILHYEEHLRGLSEWQRRQALEDYFAETRRRYGLGVWRGREDNYGLHGLGLVDCNSFLGT